MRLPRGLLAVALLCGTAAVAVVVIAILPSIITEHPHKDMTAAEVHKARHDARTVLVQSLAAIGLLGGLFYTAKTNRLAQHSFQLAENAHRLAQREYATDRYFKSIEQLGNKAEGVRIGAIYALEQLMQESDSEALLITEVLAAFLRGEARYDATVQRPEPRPDIQTALTVLARRKATTGGPVVALEDTDLRRASLIGAKLQGFSLRNAKLDGADLQDANLTGADLRDATLEAVKWRGATLFKTRLAGAVITQGTLSADQIEQAEDIKSVKWQ